MFRSTHRFPQLATALTAVALAAPAAAPGSIVDHRSPDAVDAGIQVTRAEQASQAQDLPASGPVDHRSPDAVDAGIQVRRAEQASKAQELAASGPVDHRSADAMDTTFVRTPEPATIVKSSGFDWGDAGVGAGTILGLLLIALSVLFTVTHRRNRPAAV